jgi:thiamine-phosphate pyrophosphorylase
MLEDPLTRLYLITPPRLNDVAAFAEQLKGTLDTGGAACVQLRLKDVNDDVIRRTADILRPITQDRDVAFVINDRPDLARETGSDGVHVGQDDASYAEARGLLGNDAIVGVTCKASRHLAIEAAEAGADYVAFGAFFGSTTKETSVQATPDILEWWSETTSVPCVAIGGITSMNCGPLVTAGADFLAVISAVWAHPDNPLTAMTEFKSAIEAASV